MDAIRHIVRIPRNNELKIKIPEHIAENELKETACVYCFIQTA